MSSVNRETVDRLIARLFTRQVSDEEFFAEFETDRDDAVAFGLRVLNDAVSARDPLLVEFGNYVGFRFGFSRAHLTVLSELAEAPWHELQADVVSALAELRAPEAVDVLYRVAANPPAQLYADDRYELGRKCLYALGDIADHHALQRLDQLARGSDQRLARAAVSQLARVYADAQSTAARDEAARLLAHQDRIAIVFEAAYRHLDAKVLGLAFALAAQCGLDERCVEPLAKLLASDFRERRDDVLAALHSIDSDAARSALRQA